MHRNCGRLGDGWPNTFLAVDSTVTQILLGFSLGAYRDKGHLRLASGRRPRDGTLVLDLHPYS